MLLHICLGVGGCSLLYAIVVHLRKNIRVSGGIVLSAAMLGLQAVFHPPAGQVMTQQLDEGTEDDESGDADNPSLETQIRRQAKHIRSGQAKAVLTLRLPSRRI
jgi:hypothetical protein